MFSKIILYYVFLAIINTFLLSSVVEILLQVLWKLFPYKQTSFFSFSLFPLLEHRQDLTVLRINRIELNPEELDL